MPASPNHHKDHVCMALKSSINIDSPTMLWHYRLEHPNFMYLKKWFPSLFNEKAKTFQCEICQLSKHTHASYSSLPYKSSHPFFIIHSDIWGPSRIHNIISSKWFVTFIDNHTRLSGVFLMKEKSEVRQNLWVLSQHDYYSFSSKNSNPQN